ncbi:LacI family DNA-binding transcriptional regulator [Herbidospora sp. RD11066]
MQSAVGIKDVADHAGVSPGTVSNVLNRPEKVSEPTRLRVEAAIRELGFVRHGSASTLRAGHSKTIGLALMDIANPFFADLVTGVEETAGERGYAVILGNSAGSVVREQRNLLVLAEHRVRGVLITPTGENPAQRLRERGISVVLVDHPAARPDQCSVAVDDVAGGAMAAGHLRERGAASITYVTGPLTIRQCLDRRTGAERGGSVQVIEMTGMTANDGQAAAAKMLSEGALPDAVFCANDLMALGLLRELTRAGVRVPEDVALVGYDDIDFAAASSVPLTSVRQPTHALGRVATDLLLDECDNPATHAHQQIMFQPELVIRESTR